MIRSTRRARRCAIEQRIRAGLYRKLGFAEVGSRVTVEQPDGYSAMPQRTMWRALLSDATWPNGALTVHSLPY
jgi:hypothetical protein